VSRACDSRASPFPLSRESVQLTSAFYAALLAKLLASRRRIYPYSRTTQAASCLSTRAARVNLVARASRVNDYLHVTQKFLEFFSPKSLRLQPLGVAPLNRCGTRAM